jgi:two-component system, cell cycle sensor histidine kinase and response regulator CckA
MRVTEARRRAEEQRQHERMELLGQLAGGIAHDFNNVMTAVIGFSRLGLGRLNDPQSLRYYLEEIKRAAEGAVAMTNELLAFSRNHAPETSVVDLNELVLSLEGLLRCLIPEDVDIVTRLDPALAAVRGDPGQLDRVLVNLALNAGDAMPFGGRLTIETSNVLIEPGHEFLHDEVDPGWYVLLAMSDTGVGMDDEIVSRVFEPFFTTKGGQGTGLGLATVFGIVTHAGGAVRVESALGEGTTFRIFLPQDEPVT